MTCQKSIDENQVKFIIFKDKGLSFIPVLFLF